MIRRYTATASVVVYMDDMERELSQIDTLRLTASHMLSRSVAAGQFEVSEGVPVDDGRGDVMRDEA